MRVGEIIHMDEPATIQDTGGRAIQERVINVKRNQLAAASHNDIQAARAYVRHTQPNLARILWLYRRSTNFYECCIQVLEEPQQRATLTATDIRTFANGQMFIYNQLVGEITNFSVSGEVRPNTPTTRRMQVSYEVANITHQSIFGTVLEPSDQDPTRLALATAIQRVDSSITQVLRYQVYPEDLSIMVIYQVPENAPPLRDVSAIPAGFRYVPYNIPNLTTAIPESINPNTEPNALPDAPAVIAKDDRHKTIEDFIETPTRRRERSDIMD